MSSRLEAGDGRGRQGKRDEKLRRKLENEIKKRSAAVGQTKQSQKKLKGSVMVLKPLAPTTMHRSTSVLDAAQYMSARRADCVLVVDDNGGVSGIFTAKDLAIKIVGSQRDYRSMTIDEIMTANPICTDINTTAIDALNLMVSRSFRHLPVIDEDGEIVGVLDITKCFYEAMHRLERAYESSRKLHDALEGVKSEFGSIQPAQITNYVQALKERTAGPSLAEVVDHDKAPVFVDVRTTVSDAAALMRENHTTSVLVTDKAEEIVGIFTTKDIVLRVLAANLDPAKCSVIRVMTPRPDSASMTMSIQDALRKMHDGHYLNLPVINEQEDAVVGVVDVLRLVYATLEQINTMSSNEDTGDGPAWNKFWMSLEDDGTESVGSSVATGSRADTAPTDASVTELAQFSMVEEPIEMTRPTTSSEIRPEDSLSRTGMRSEDLSQLTSFSFKFKAPSGRVNRIIVNPQEGISAFRQAVAAKLTANELREVGGLGEVVEDVVSGGFAVSYIDDDGDLVSIMSSHDVIDAAVSAASHGQSRADIILHHVDEQPLVKQPIDWIPYAVGGVAVLAIAVFAFGRK